MNDHNSLHEDIGYIRAKVEKIDDIGQKVDGLDSRMSGIEKKVSRITGYATGVASVASLAIAIFKDFFFTSKNN